MYLCCFSYYLWSKWKEGWQVRTISTSGSSHVQSSTQKYRSMDSLGKNTSQQIFISQLWFNVGCRGVFNGTPEVNYKVSLYHSTASGEFPIILNRIDFQIKSVCTEPLRWDRDGQPHLVCAVWDYQGWWWWWRQRKEKNCCFQPALGVQVLFVAF